MTSNPLATKAVLASLHIRHWTGRKLDREVTEEVNEERGATSDAGRYNKLLLPKEAFKDVYSELRLARTRHAMLTLPWFSDGTGILPTALYDSFANEFRERKEAFNTAADAFARNFPVHKAARKAELGKMFNEDDYPSHNYVRGMFDFRLRIMPCPDVKDFRVTLSEEQIDDVKTELQAELDDALRSAMQEPIRRIVEVVGKMTEKLKGYKPAGKNGRAEGTFRDSLVTNIEELLPLLGAFNLTGDKRLTELFNRVSKELCKHTPETLREDDRVRKTVAQSAEDILKQANALMG